MQSNTSEIFKVERFLESIGYPDSYRISREIVGFVNQNEGVSIQKIFDQLKEGKPWEYISGKVEFCENIFKVSKHTLIPRIETEQLVYDSLEIVKSKGIKNIIDVGSGSGCIAISLAYFLKDFDINIYATDISSKALDIGKTNEEEILGKKQIKWIKTDLIQDIPTLLQSTLLVANLPYIPTKQYIKLDKSVLDYEPKIALDGGIDGLYYYKKLFKQIKEKNPNVKFVYIETESSIFNQTKKLILNYFPQSKVVGIKDCFQKNRFLKISF